MTKKIAIKLKIKRNIVLVFSLLVGAVFRYYKLTHGYPYVINIDEPALVRSTLGLFFSSHIEHFDWPHFNYYVHFIFYFLFVKIRALFNLMGLGGFLKPVAPFLWNDPFSFYWLSRFVNATFGFLTTIPIYLLAEKMFSKRVGEISAILFALLPAHITFSHIAIQEPMLLFWLSWALYFAYIAVMETNTRYFIVSGVLFAFAAGAKYHAIVLAVAMPLFIFVRVGKVKKKLVANYVNENWIKFVYAGVASVLVFALTNYRIIADWDIFWSHDYGRGFLWQISENSSPVPLSVYPSFLAKNFWSIVLGFGVLPIVFYFYSVKKFLTLKLNKESLKFLSLFISSVVFILFTARTKRATAHYFVPAYGLVVILISASLGELDEKLKKIILVTTIASMLVFDAKTIYKYHLGYTTQRLALDYYGQAKIDGNATYVVGNTLDTVKVVNNLKLKKLKSDTQLNVGDIIISTSKLTDDRINLLKTIDNKGLNGPTLYVYEANP